jgi:hypothetical protein
MKGQRMLNALYQAVCHAGDSPQITHSYQGKSDWLVVYGVGAEVNHVARQAQNTHGHTLHLDLGYTDRQNNMRICVDSDHPDQWFWKTDEGKSEVQFFDEYDPKGPIILVGLGRKSRQYLKAFDWEAKKYRELQREFPGRKIIFRPKGTDLMRLPCKTDRTTPFHELIKGASLVVARHSNCCVDALVQGIPFRSEAGAAMAFDGNRQKFMNKLARWEYSPDQAAEAWKFAKEIIT